MNTNHWQILLMLVLLLLSAFFSATETAFSSLNRARLKSMADRGDRRAAAALALSERYDELLSTVLIGNNIVNIALASVATVYFVRLLGDAGVSLSTAAVTVVVLLFGEISPKSVAKEMAERVAMAVTPVVGGLMAVLKPVNWLFSKWKALFSRIFSIKGEHGITQDELLTLVNEAEKEGGMNAEESDLLKSAIQFNDRFVTDILTPRVKVEGIPADAEQQDITDILVHSNHSRLPVYEESLDHIIGILHQKDYFHHLREGRVSLPDLIQKPLFVPETAKLSGTLRLMQQTRSQMAVVADEYGGTIGVLTMEDILEELVGEIWDEHDQVEEPVRRVNDSTYLVAGDAPLEALEKRFQFDMADSEATTLSGWVMEQTERVPTPGDSFPWNGWKFDVLKADGRHVVEMKMSRLP